MREREGGRQKLQQHWKDLLAGRNALILMAARAAIAKSRRGLFYSLEG